MNSWRSTSRNPIRRARQSRSRRCRAMRASKSSARCTWGSAGWPASATGRHRATPGRIIAWRWPGARGQAHPARHHTGPGPAVRVAVAIRGSDADFCHRQRTPGCAPWSKVRSSSPKSCTDGGASCCAASPTARAPSPCVSFTSPLRSRRISRAARASAASAKCVVARWGWRSCTRSTGRIGVEDAPLEEVLTPIYPTTEGVPQARLRYLIDLALREAEASGVRDWIPPRLLAPLELPSLVDALTMMHRPPRDAHLPELLSGRHPAQRRLAFEELLANQLSLRMLRQSIKADPAESMLDSAGVEQRFAEITPFALTGAQARTLAEVDRDLAAERPMVRLVQGDVGCGKTVIAAAAAARAVGSGLQAALMAPTELLAEQHARNFERWFRPLDIPVALITGSQKARARRSALEMRCRRRDQAGGRHPRVVPGVDRVRLSRPGDRRRAAPLRRASAPVAA